MAKKSGRKPDKTAENEPEKQAANQPEKKIRIAVVLLALIVLGCAIIFGSGLLNTSPSPNVPAVPNTTLTATTNPTLAPATNATLTATYFYGNGCIHCDKVQPLIDGIQARHPELHIEMLEVNDNKDNFDTFVTVLRQYGINETEWGIPAVFIGKNALIGETEIKDHFEEDILAEKQRNATVNSLK
jgi:thiol-disulfide isomerase/thioredoxin